MEMTRNDSQNRKINKTDRGFIFAPVYFSCI